ncbi:death-inducer obliterator 1 isoform X2 [Culicoides brevitarsis]|uniref:death-inducer obliterator 1 isoform X2 n=1 Tax=Culicoides brevitarsis TaxID=469753 RepID=UPI00307C83EA
MSSSTFIDIDDKSLSTSLNELEDQKLKVESNLIIVINNKSGKVSVDERTLHSLLADETTQTSVSIVSVCSPTPSMQNEIDAEDTQRNGEDETDENEEESMKIDVDSTVKSQLCSKKGFSCVGITIENHYSPKQSKSFVADVLKLAGIENRISIDYEFQRYVIQNDHCYTNSIFSNKCKLVSSKKQKNVQNLPSPSKRALETNETKEKYSEKQVKNNKAEEDALESSESEYGTENTENTSLEDNDDESDLDFEINRSSRSFKKNKKKRKISKNKSVLRQGISKISKKRQWTRLTDFEEAGTSKDSINKGHISKTNLLDKTMVAYQRKISKGKQLPRSTESKIEENATPKVTISSEEQCKVKQLKSVNEEDLSVNEKDVFLNEKELYKTEITGEYDEMKTVQNTENNTYPENSLLETLGGTLPEDFMYSVAELAENKEIQEIIDKQVQGMEIDSSNVSEVNETAAINICNKVTNSDINTKVSDGSPSKLLRVITSHSRVIDLPQIELPSTSTKGAKKRRQSNNMELEADVSESKMFETFKNKNETSRTEEPCKLDEINVSEKNKDIIKTKRKRRITNPAVLAVLSNEKNNESESADSWNSEDDPDRLWCICRQPHNNRFMICCDVCEEWFHGKCVNVTKSQGNQMESAGKDWTCPNCLNEKQNKVQPKITTFLEPSKLTFKTENLCIICKSITKKGSVYCSDNCISNHINDVLLKNTNKLISNEGTKIIGEKDNEKINVVEKSTNRYLSGENAPSVMKIKQWLKDHPSFQIATETEMHSLKSSHQHKKEWQGKKDTQKFVPNSKLETKQKTVQSQFNSPPSSKEIFESIKPTPKIHSASSNYRQTSTNKSSHEKKNVTQQTMSTSKDIRDHDIIRAKSREGLQAALEERMIEIKKTNAVHLTTEEIKEFAHSVENELYLLFNKDCNQKYKMKYRSLIFNIRDRKNLTLFQKICEKSIKPFRLVRMDPQALASQELAKWREMENKHQLDIIKKSELELLACSKNYVVKTHKGEEFFETKNTESKDLDTKMAVDDIQSTDSPADSNEMNILFRTSKSQEKSQNKYTEKKYDEKEKKHHRSSKHSKHKRKHSKDRSESRHSRNNSNKKSRHEKKYDKSQIGAQTEEKMESIESLEMTAPTEEDFNLIDKILEGSQVILNRPKNSLASNNIKNSYANTENYQKSLQYSESVQSLKKESLTNLPSEKCKTIWRGNINMIDVASFFVEISPLLGDAASVKTHFPKSLEIVGRIAPETVWDYIEKIQKSPNKEIIVVRFSSPEEVNYVTLYQYYIMRRRFGVIKSNSSVVKDFYIFPLPAENDLPHILSSIKGIGFLDEKNKPNLLIGVIVKTISKQGSRTSYKQSPTLQISKESMERKRNLVMANVEQTSSFSKKSKLLSLSLPKTNFKDEDEPYTPEDSDENVSIIDKNISESSIQSNIIGQEVIKLNQINREIEVRKIEIAGMLKVDCEQLSEPYSPSRPVDSPRRTKKLPSLDQIAIPSNLSEILASIKSSTHSVCVNDTTEKYDTSGKIENSNEGYNVAQMSHKNLNEAKICHVGQKDLDLRILQQAVQEIGSQNNAKNDTIVDIDLRKE